ICAPYLHDHDSVELKEAWFHSQDISDVYFVTATFSNESKLYFPTCANHYLLAKFKASKKMKKEFKEVITINKKRIIRITCPDERWYARLATDKKTGLPGSYEFIPSVTWIKSYWYTSPYLIKWIADKGLSEAETIRNEAGIKGDKVHQATEDIDNGIGIKIDDKYENYSTIKVENISYCGINFIVLDNGVAVSINEQEQIEVFFNKKDSTSLKVIENEVVTGDMRLFKNGTQVLFGKDKKLYRMKIKK
ncbi:hypothetical protein LCGC14_2818070, partial [marine sediment metagenome]